MWRNIVQQLILIIKMLILRNGPELHATKINVLPTDIISKRKIGKHYESKNF
jgi:hypothetical protein